MFKNVLVPTDGSATALRAAHECAALLTANPELKVTVVLAIAPLTPEQTDYAEETINNINTRMQSQAEAALAATCRAFSENGITCETKVIQGDPVSRAIADESVQGKYDLIVMGSRGMGMQKNDLHYLGSVTEHTIRRVSIPVLVVPTHKG